MRRRLSHRILVIVLVVTRLALGEFLHLPAADASGHAQASSTMMMMAGEPCPGMDSGTPTDHAGHPMPTNDGTCCKSSQCPCLHAPALMVALQIPMMFGLSYAEVSTTADCVIGDPPAVFFRPPI